MTPDRQSSKQTRGREVESWLGDGCEVQEDRAAGDVQEVIAQRIRQSPRRAAPGTGGGGSGSVGDFDEDPATGGNSQAVGESEGADGVAGPNDAGDRAAVDRDGAADRPDAAEG